MADFYASYPASAGGGSITTGDLTDVGTDGIIITGGTGAVVGSGTQLAQHVADASHNGYLSSTDWSTFNSKQNALTNPLTRLSVDQGAGRVQNKDLDDASTKIVNTADTTKQISFEAVAIGSGKTATIHFTNANDAIYAFPTTSQVIVGTASTDTLTNKSINASNNTITNIANTNIAAAAAIALDKLAATTASRALVSDGSGFVSAATTTAAEIGFVNGVTSAIQTQLNAKQATGNYITALTGDVTASGPGSVAATIAAGAVTNAKIVAAAGISVNKLAALTVSSNVRSDASGFLTTGAVVLSTADVSGTLPIGNGGTGQTTKAPAFDALSPMSASGDIIYGGASGTGTRLVKGSDGQVLTLASGLPSWAAAGVFTPTTLTDAQATALGYKTYSSGTTYNGGLAPTITLSAGGGTLTSVSYSYFIPYQVQDATWRMRFNLTISVSSTARSSATITINGVTFLNSAYSSVSGYNSAVQVNAAAVLTNSSNVYMEHGTTLTTSYGWSGDVQLNAKPTWAY